MQLRFTQMLAGLRQALRFLDANRAAVPAAHSDGGRAALAEVTTRLGTLAESQDTHRTRGSGQLSTERHLAHVLRRHHMKAIVRAAKVQVPELAELEALQMPGLRSNNTQLTSKARSMADAVTPYRDKLAPGGGLKPDFVARLRAAAAALDVAIAGKGGHFAGRKGTTAAIERGVQNARRVLNLVDTVVTAEIEHVEPLATEWKSILRTTRRALASPASPVGSPPPTNEAGTPAVSPAQPRPAASGPVVKLVQ